MQINAYEKNGIKNKISNNAHHNSAVINLFLHHYSAIIKGLKQIQAVYKVFVVKDNIELAYFNTIPLRQFGLTY